MAMKVVKSAEHYTETALDEIKLLRAVSYPDTCAAVESITMNYSQDHLVSDKFESMPHCGGKVIKVSCSHRKVVSSNESAVYFVINQRKWF